MYADCRNLIKFANESNDLRRRKIRSLVFSFTFRLHSLNVFFLFFISLFISSWFKNQKLRRQSWARNLELPPYQSCRLDFIGFNVKLLVIGTIEWLKLI